MVTLISTGCGVFSIFSAIEHRFEMAAVFLFAAVLFDRLDGKLARMMGLQERAFGKELDSLSDAVSFGIAPAIFGYTLGLTSFPGILVLLLFVCCCILRLARFNITKMENGYFLGMNLAYNNVIFPLLYFLTAFSETWRINTFLIAYAASCFLMLSSIKWKKI